MALNKDINRWFPYGTSQNEYYLNYKLLYSGNLTRVIGPSQWQVLSNQEDIGLRYFQMIFFDWNSNNSSPFTWRWWLIDSLAPDDSVIWTKKVAMTMQPPLGWALYQSYLYVQADHPIGLPYKFRMRTPPEFSYQRSANWFIKNSLSSY